MRGIAFALIAFGLVLALLGAWILQRPDLGPWQARHELAPSRCARGPEAPACVEVQWLGVATLVFDDGRTRLLTDGFFSRPGLGDLVFGRPVSPDLTAIEDGLRRAGVDRADAVMTVHSHYDHAMDAPEVVPFPTRLDDVEATLRELEGRAERSPGLEMALLPAWEPVVLLGD